MRFFLLIFLSNIFQTVFAQSSELPFKDGEKFEYDIFFEFIPRVKERKNPVAIASGNSVALVRHIEER